jgi:hypothetical protein
MPPLQTAPMTRQPMTRAADEPMDVTEAGAESAEATDEPEAAVEDAPIVEDPPAPPRHPNASSRNVAPVSFLW